MPAVPAFSATSARTLLGDRHPDWRLDYGSLLECA